MGVGPSRDGEAARPPNPTLSLPNQSLAGGNPATIQPKPGPAPLHQRAGTEPRLVAQRRSIPTAVPVPVNSKAPSFAREIPQLSASVQKASSAVSPVFGSPWTDAFESSFSISADKDVRVLPAPDESKFSSLRIGSSLFVCSRETSFGTYRSYLEPRRRECFFGGIFQ